MMVIFAVKCETPAAIENITKTSLSRVMKSNLNQQGTGPQLSSMFYQQKCLHIFSSYSGNKLGETTAWSGVEFSVSLILHVYMMWSVCIGFENYI